MNAILVLLVLAAPFTSAYYCCLYRNQYQSNPHLYAIASSSYQCARQITGWGNTIKTPWFVVNPAYCGKMALMGLRDIDLSSHLSQTSNLDDEEDSMQQRYDPVHCCLYIPKLNYYTQPVYTVAVNPQSNKPFCPDQNFGIPMISEWYVESMYNQCFFVTFTNNTLTE
eukprot:TRINITY_DN7870_c0_g1_i1.p1 TRINITY_DN7870_c0_g1~~TRINITY_DN7870_c0_g1_i1.p1  ORF type:complete len:197 (+),score=15.01 TRINITY_DN7870_c0_g1_i1:89-592(+)